MREDSLLSTLGWWRSALAVSGKKHLRWAIVKDVRTLLHDPAYGETLQKLKEVVALCSPQEHGKEVSEEPKAMKLAA